MKEHILNLLTEAKIESEYKRYQDLLDYETYEKIVTKDPDYRNGYLGKFGHWLVKIFLGLRTETQKHRFVEEDLPNDLAQDAMKLFLRFKSQITDRNDKDLNKMKKLEDLFDVIDKYKLRDRLSKSDKEKAKERGESEVYTFYEGNNWVILSILTHEAMKFWGQETRWCVVSSATWFNRYISQSELLLLVPKVDGNPDRLSKKRILYHAETKQFMDVQNEPENPIDFFNTNPELQEDRDSPFYNVFKTVVFKVEKPEEWAVFFEDYPDNALSIDLIRQILSGEDRDLFSSNEPADLSELFNYCFSKETIEDIKKIYKERDSEGFVLEEDNVDSLINYIKENDLESPYNSLVSDFLYQDAHSSAYNEIIDIIDTPKKITSDFAIIYSNYVDNWLITQGVGHIECTVMDIFGQYLEGRTYSIEGLGELWTQDYSVEYYFSPVFEPRYGFSGAVDYDSFCEGNVLDYLKREQ